LKIGAGVASSSTAPSTPPASDGRVPRTIQSRRPPSSRRKPCSAASDPGASDTVFVALARIGSRPSHTSNGNVISEPPPATELIAPAMVDAPNRINGSVPVIDWGAMARPRMSPLVGQPVPEVISTCCTPAT
jgi:hypothetical protein